ncbi:MAG: DEAD/DEAH box helicase [Acidimicrobiales bacterium]
MTPRDFQLDRFQLDAISVLDSGRSVLVAAPTGSGKTVVAEHAIADAIKAGEKVFYTTPIKALSNQKFRDFREIYGVDKVGLLTGDNAVNPEAAVVVMTTEVLRNMLYAGSDLLHRLRYVVLDEVHYLQDAYRGPVWEEVIIHLPLEVRLVALSATVSNADELAAWITQIRSETVAVVETERPVELRDLYAVAERGSRQLEVMPVLIKGSPNREAFRFDATGRRDGRHSSSKGRPKGRRRFVTPRRLDVISYLNSKKLLPVIFFVFSRAGCDDAVSGAVDRGLDLTTDAERDEIRAIATAHCAHLSAPDLLALEYERFRSALERGVASHHAGMVPAFKETVELCFVAGLVKAVFATETLAMGINMPAKTVVLDKLTKFTGEHHEALTPGQYTQLTGRAGRRGIDPVGHAVVLWSPFVQFDQVARLVGSSSFPLYSSFRPSYNMAVNLVERVDEADAHELLRRSFAQFQADRAIVKLDVRSEKLRASIASTTEKLSLDREVLDKAALSAPASHADRDLIASAIERLVPGDVLAASPDHEQAVVISSAYRRGQARIRLVNSSGDSFTIDSDDFSAPPHTVGKLDLPEPYAPNSDRFVNTVGHELGLATFRKNRRAGPDTGRPRHLEAVQEGEGNSSVDIGRHDFELLEQIHDDERQLTKIAERIAGRSGSITRQFDAVKDVLEELDYLNGWILTERGRTLRRLYHERDLLIAESLSSGLLDGLDEAELAGMVSGFTYEHRSSTAPPAPWFPTKTTRHRFGDLERLHRSLIRIEKNHGLLETTQPDATLFAAVYAWSLGSGLDDVLDDDLTGGDFVRQVKQIIDLLRQIATAATLPDTRRCAAAAADRLDRGVVTASGVIGDPSNPVEP